MTDKKTSTPPDATLTDLSHLAFCALAALGLARQDGQAGTPYAETLFLIRWLTAAQKQKRFPKSVAADIVWLLNRGRKHGPAARLRQHLEYLWRSSSGNLAEQSDLFRLTYVTESLKDRGWENQVLSAAEWARLPADIVTLEKGFLVTKPALQRAFDNAGNQTAPVAFRIVGDSGVFLQTLADCGFTARVTETTPVYATVTLFPADPPA